MTDKNFLINYFSNLKNLLQNDKYLEDLIKVKKILVETHNSKNKTMIFGNGGSAAIASHFSVDLTKNARIRCTNYNESDLLTCFSNDYGYEKWIENAIKYYCDKGDMLILVSSSGESKNIVNAAKYFKKKNYGKLITYTGHKYKNNLKRIGDVNFWVNSKSYNLIENVHQFLLLSVVDLIIGKSKYKTNR